MTNERNIPIPSPGDVVTFTILINGEAIPGTIGIKSIAVAKEVNRISYAQLSILDGSAAQENFEVSSGTSFLPGNEIEIQLGYSSDEQTLFKGIITKHGLKTRRNNSSELRIECRDKAYKMTLNRHSKYFYELTDGELCEQMASDNGVETDTIETDSFTNSSIVQMNVSDWDFLLSRSEACNKLLFTDDGKLSFRKPDLSGEPTLSLTYGANIMEFEAEIDARDQYAAVSGESWDYTNLEVLTLESANANFEEAGNLSTVKLSETVGLESLNARHSGQLKTEELQSWIDARMLKSKLSKINGRVSFQGFAGVKPGDLIELEGLGDRFNGNVFVASVNHEVAQGGWITHVQFGMSRDWFSAHVKGYEDQPASGVIPAVNGLQIGIVTALEGDPEGEFRIQVKLPLISDQDEGIWARVATLDAGGNRGTFFLPEIEDEVVVGFLNDDPRDAIILGMLNSSSKPAAFEASDDNHVKGYSSRDELKLVFNDDEKSITISTPSGNKLQLSEDSGHLLLEDENGNSIIMDSSGITLESAADLILKASGDLKFEGTNIELGANAQMKVSGSASTDITSSGSLKIEGSIVQIN
ncbi:type VI secretion system tip protein VgrG [Sunxiuqinia indica]|uniref:type VI secretion system tip protein VgrG n=1 Tax=Sunxiuqinia indica TaxID=2692584 RepID=UPI001357AF17|nr:type VI secretion system tip protein VgrG [Sunxiuqinia indica]